MKLNECYQVGACSVTCPKDLDPREHLDALKKMYMAYKHKKDEKRASIGF